jgi:hypothetical protein
MMARQTAIGTCVFSSSVVREVMLSSRFGNLEIEDFQFAEEQQHIDRFSAFTSFTSGRRDRFERESLPSLIIRW